MTLIPDLVKHQADNSGPHRAGTLAAEPLTRIEQILSTHFAGKKVRSAETGCGASTVLFAHYGAEHHVYAYDDTIYPNSSVNFAKTFKSFNDAKVTWHFGPTQHTLVQSPPSGKFDMVLIDGPHGYPWPEFEYAFFYHLLNEDGILVIDDIHIPTIRNMFTFLLEDDMFFLDSVVLTTAFFRRTSMPTFPPDGDHWWMQRYNIQQFPAPYPVAGRPIKDKLSLSGSAALDLRQYVKRGFTNYLGKLTTESRISMLEIPFDKPVSGKCKVSVDVAPLFADQRPDAGCEIYLNHVPCGSFKFGKTSPTTIIAETKLQDATSLEIKLHHVGTVTYDKLKHDVPPVMVDQRLMNFSIDGLELTVKK
jgi:hypothetical protein